jgi:hypothetical protein
LLAAVVSGRAQVAGVTCAVTVVRDHGHGGWSCPWLLFTDPRAVVVAVAERLFASSAFDRQGSPKLATRAAARTGLSSPEDPTISCQNDNWLIAEPCSRSYERTNRYEPGIMMCAPDVPAFMIHALTPDGLTGSFRLSAVANGTPIVMCGRAVA